MSNKFQTAENFYHHKIDTNKTKSCKDTQENFFTDTSDNF